MTSTVQALVNQPYKYGFVTDIESDVIPRGLSEDTVRMISAIKEEPEWMLAFRLKAYRQWLKMATPEWAHVEYPAIDYQNIIYYSAPKVKAKLNSLDEVDPELLDTFEKLGISLSEQKRLTNVNVAEMLFLTAFRLRQPLRTSLQAMASFSARCQKPLKNIPNSLKNICPA